MRVKNVVFFTFNQIESAVEFYRFISPLKAAGIELIPGVVAGEVRLENLQGADMVCFQRDFSKHFKAYQAVLSEAHMQGIPLVMDLDDHLLALPPDHPDRLSGDFADSLPAMMHAILMSDALTVTTPELKQELLDFNPNIAVLPNYLDKALWQFRQPVLRSADAQVRILFMGTPTHAPDLESIAVILKNIAKRFDNKVRFIFFGAKPPTDIADFARVIYHPLKSYNFRLFQQEFYQLEADIAIAPLNDNVFNRCKSAIKYLEYSVLGLPAVYTEIPPYTTVVRNGENGFLAMDQLDWERKLEILIDDPALCLRMAEKAQEDIRQQWLLQNHAHEWSEVYDNIALGGSKRTESPSSIEKGLEMAALQLEELRDLNKSHYSGLREELTNQQDENLSNRRLLKALQAELFSKDGQIETLQDEAVNYANSRSWKFTRPLRKLNRLIGRLLKK